MPKIEYEGTIHEFPDDFTDEEISAALSGSSPSPVQPQPQANPSVSGRSYGERMMQDVPRGIQNPLNLVYDIATGLGKAGQGIATTFTGGRAPTVNFDELNPNKNIDVRNRILQGMAQYAPFGLAGGASLLGQVGAGLGFGATQTGSNEKNAMGLLPEGKTGGAIESAALNALTHGLFRGLNNLRPSRLFRGNLNPEELTRNVEAAGETPTGLGDVIESPFLKRQYENVISKLPFSGATEKMQQAGKQVMESGENVLSEMLGKNKVENVEEQLNKNLIRKFKQHTNMKNDLYTDFNDEAEKQFLDLPLKKFSSLATEYKDAIEGTNILKLEPDMKKILTKLNIYENPVVKIPGDTKLVNKQGNPLIGDQQLTTHIYPTAKEANLLKGKLNHYQKLYGKSPDPEKRHMAGIFGKLSSALKSDINDAIETSGNPLLKEKYQKAEENYKKNFSRFLDRDIYKFLGDTSNSDTIGQKFIQTSRGSDKGKQISKISNLLSPQSKNLLSYSYFSRALDNEGNLNPAKLSTLVNNLGKRQLRALVPDKNMQNKLTNFKRLYKMNTKGVNLMQNPATGQQALDILPGILGHAGASITGGMLAGLPGAFAGLALPGLVSRPLVNLLTNPGTRRNLINAMIKNKTWNPAYEKLLQTTLQGMNRANK